jgi:S1-C subfamily serine protease
VAFGGGAIATDDQLRDAILRYKPGDRATVGLVRSDGSRVTVTATLGVRPLGP